jgi:hypothetical protein
VALLGRRDFQRDQGFSASCDMLGDVHGVLCLADT